METKLDREERILVLYSHRPQGILKILVVRGFSAQEVQTVRFAHTSFHQKGAPF